MWGLAYYYISWKTKCVILNVTDSIVSLPIENYLRKKVSSDVWIHKTFYTLPKLQEIVLEERNKLLENHTSDETLLQTS